MKTRGSVAACVLVAGCVFPAIAQVEPFVDGGRGAPVVPEKPGRAPLSQLLGMRLANVPALTLTPYNNNFAIAEDSVNDWGGKPRVSVPRDVPFDWRAGRWFDVAGGGSLWVLDVVSPNAYGVRVHIQGMDLPDGVEATVYAPGAPDRAPWPYTGKGPHNGDFWATTSYGETARIEVFVPANVRVDRANPLLWIDKVQHLYRDPLTGEAGPVSQELGCHIDVTCQAAWANDAVGVARMYFVDGGGFVCTGSMLNTFASDWTPYFLTAAHCLSTQAVADTLETYWRFQTTTCNAAAPALPPAVNDATLLATGAPSDFTFLMIEGTIDRNLWWEGWDAGNFADGLAAYGIHHPGGTYKRWSQGTTSAPTNSCSVTGITSRVTGTWSSGTTEPGSSGSPLFDTNHRVRGTLSCANASCGAGDRRFHYGRFETSYSSISSLLNAGSDDGLEDNDTCATARDITYIGSQTYFSRIVKSVDEDWYSITIPGGGSLSASVSFTHAYGDIDIRLDDGCGGATLATSAGTSNSESVTYNNTLSTPKVVKLRVYMYNDTRNTYSLSTTVTPPPVPGNNTCGSYIFFNVGDTITGVTTGASTDGSATCGLSNASPDVWYGFYSSCAGPITLSLQGSAYDTVLSVHAFNCPGTTTNEVACNDDYWGYQSQVTFNAAAGTYYLARVAGYNGAAGTFIMNSYRPAPANDSCAAAISVGSGSTPFDTCGALTDGPAQNGCNFYNNVNQDVWYLWTAPANGSVTADTFGSAFDTVLASYTGPSCALPAGSALACNDDFSGLQSSISWSVAASQTYLIRVGGYNAAAGTGTLHINFAAGGCDSIDFNGDGLYPDTADIDDFLSVFSGGPCSTGTCGDIDFNNDGLFPDTSDIDSLLSVFSGGPCL
ncbi:MAG: trypsin-like peptidase domain-containing protein [Phycisphaerales bacterium]